MRLSVLKASGNSPGLSTLESACSAKKEPKDATASGRWGGNAGRPTRAHRPITPCASDAGKWSIDAVGAKSELFNDRSYDFNFKVHCHLVPPGSLHLLVLLPRQLPVDAVHLVLRIRVALAESATLSLFVAGSETYRLSNAFTMLLNQKKLSPLSMMLIPA